MNAETRRKRMILSGVLFFAGMMICLVGIVWIIVERRSGPVDWKLHVTTVAVGAVHGMIGLVAFICARSVAVIETDEERAAEK